MTDDTNMQTNTGNGSAPLSKEASTRAQVQCLITLAKKASEEAVRAAIAAQDASTAAHNVSIVLEKLAEYMDAPEHPEPTQGQRDAFHAWFKAEGNGGATQADREREVAMVELWRKLHPGSSSLLTETGLSGTTQMPLNADNRDDEIPF